METAIVRLYAPREIFEGILSIQAGENPHVIEEKLKTFLAPSLRASIGEQEGEGGGG